MNWWNTGVESRAVFKPRELKWLCSYYGCILPWFLIFPLLNQFNRPWVNRARSIHRAAFQNGLQWGCHSASVFCCCKMQFSGAFENPDRRAYRSLPKQIKRVPRLGARQLFPLCNTLNVFLCSLWTHLSLPVFPQPSVLAERVRGGFNSASSRFHSINHLTSPSQNTLPGMSSECCLILAPFLSALLLPPPGWQSSEGWVAPAHRQAAQAAPAAWAVRAAQDLAVGTSFPISTAGAAKLSGSSAAPRSTVSPPQASWRMFCQQPGDTPLMELLSSACLLGQVVNMLSMCRDLTLVKRGDAFSPFPFYQ